MPTIQSTYADTIGVAYAGAIANTEPSVIISRTVEDSGGINFGLAVMQGVNDKGCVVGDGTAFLGVTVRTQSVRDGTADAFEYQDEARIMTKGVIWVLNSGGVNAGDAVELLADGRLGAAASAALAGARWDTTAADNQLAQLRLG